MGLPEPRPGRRAFFPTASASELAARDPKLAEETFCLSPLLTSGLAVKTCSSLTDVSTWVGPAPAPIQATGFPGEKVAQGLCTGQVWRCVEGPAGQSGASASPEKGLGLRTCQGVGEQCVPQPPHRCLSGHRVGRGEVGVAVEGAEKAPRKP